MVDAATLAKSIRTASPEEIPVLSRELMALGPEAIPKIIIEMSSGESVAQGCLGAIVEAQKATGAEPFLVAALEHEQPHTLSVLRALSHHPRASFVLTEFVDRTREWSFTARSVALWSIGRQRNQDSLSYLLARAARCFDGGFAEVSARSEELCETGVVEEALCLVVALARFDHRKYSAFPGAVLDYQFAADFDDYMVRERAGAALRDLAGKATWAATTRAAGDADPEIRRHVCWSLFFFGVPEAVPYLVELSQDQDAEVSHNASVFLLRLLPDGACDGNDWSSVLSENESKFVPGVPIRGGEPLDLGKLVDQVERGIAVSDALGELSVFSGEDFGQPSFFDTRNQKHVVERVRSWWTQSAGSYPPGKIYRHGFLWPFR